MERGGVEEGGGGISLLEGESTAKFSVKKYYLINKKYFMSCRIYSNI